MGSFDLNRQHLLMFLAVCALFTATEKASCGLLIFSTNQTINSSNSFPDDDVEVIDGPTGPTTLTLTTGGIAQDITLSEHSIGNMLDGTARNFFVNDHGQFNFSGGVITNDIRPTGNAVITMSGGIVMDDIRILDNSIVNISGGTINDDIVAQDNSVAKDKSPTFIITGGIIGGAGTFRDNSIVNIYGGNFRLNGTLVPFGNMSGTGRLSGILKDGSPLNLWIYENNSNVVLYDSPIPPLPVPCPSSFISCIIGFIVLVTMSIHCRVFCP